MMLVIQHALAAETRAFVDLDGARERLLLAAQKPTSRYWRYRYHVAAARFIACARNLQSASDRASRFLDCARRKHVL